MTDAECLDELLMDVSNQSYDGAVREVARLRALDAPSPVVEALDRAWRTRCEDYEPWPDGEGDRSSADMTAEHVYDLLRDAAIAAIREGGGR
jgi:hypothetical protein